MDDFGLRHNRERTAIREISIGIQGQELGVACKRIISCEANTVWCGNIDRHKADWMIGNETECLFSQRVADNFVIDDRFPDLQLPNTDNFFRQHQNSPSLLCLKQIRYKVSRKRCGLQVRRAMSRTAQIFPLSDIVGSDDQISLSLD